MIHHGVDVAGDHQEIQIADGLPAASIAAGGGDLLHGFAGVHVRQDFLHVLVGLDPQDPPLGLGGDVEPFQNGRLGLGAEAFEVLDPMCLAGRAEVLQRGDLQLVVQLGRPLGPQAGHAKDGQHALGNLGQQFFEHRQRAGFHQRGHFLRQVLADAFDIGKRPLGIGHDVGRRFRQVVDRPRGVAIGADSERIGPLELQQVGDVLENGGDFVIGHGRKGLGT